MRARVYLCARSIVIISTSGNRNHRHNYHVLGSVTDVNDSACARPSNEISVSVDPVSPITITRSAPLCNGNVIFSASSASDLTYDWTNCDSASSNTCTVNGDLGACRPAPCVTGRNPSGCSVAACSPSAFSVCASSETAVCTIPV